MTKSLTQEDLQRALNYCPITGHFTWKVSVGARGKQGNRAGRVHHSGYRHIFIAKKSYTEHRLAFLYMTGEIPEYVDHINNKRDDNKWENLREASREENNRNALIRIDNTTGIKGITIDKRRGYYVVRLGIGGVRKFLGCYKDLELAELVLNEAREHYHKEFARHG